MRWKESERDREGGSDSKNEIKREKERKFLRERSKEGEKARDIERPLEIYQERTRVRE